MTSSSSTTEKKPFCKAVCHDASPIHFAVNQASLTNLFAGGVGGVISRTCVSPFERLKILMQTQRVIPGVPPKYNGGFFLAADSGHCAFFFSSLFAGVVQSLKLMVKEDGYRGLFKGNAANVVRIFPTSGLQFFCNGHYKQMFGGRDPPSRTTRIL